MILNRRINLPDTVKRKIDGPCHGGTFWGLDGMNDAVRNGDPVAFGDLAFMLKNGTVWMTDDRNQQDWKQVHQANDLPKFQVTITDDFNACAVRFDVLPFQPQFFFVPKNRKGRRFLDRAHTRAWNKFNQVK